MPSPQPWLAALVAVTMASACDGVSDRRSPDADAPDAGVIEPVELNWYPGYYLLTQSSSQAKTATLRDAVAWHFDGVAFRYEWADIETSPGDFAAGFAALDADLAAVADAGQRLIVFLTYKKNDGTTAVPADLAVPPPCSGACGAEWNDGAGHALPALWRPEVSARLVAWLAAMAAHAEASPHRDALAGFILPETAVAGLDDDAIFAAGYTAQAYYDGIIANLDAVRTAAPHAVVVQNITGGFRGDPDRGNDDFTAAIATWATTHVGAGTGEADLVPAVGPTTVPCFKAEFAGVIPCFIAIEAPDFHTDKTPSLAASVTFAASAPPTGAGAAVLLVSHNSGPGPNAFEPGDFAAFIPDHPWPNQARPSWAP